GGHLRSPCPQRLSGGRQGRPGGHHVVNQDQRLGTTDGPPAPSAHAPGTDFETLLSCPNPFHCGHADRVGTAPCGERGHHGHLATTPPNHPGGPVRQTADVVPVPPPRRSGGRGYRHQHHPFRSGFRREDHPGK